MIIFLIIAQILSIFVSTYLLLLEKKYCKHLDWWSDAGAMIFFVLNLIPFLGLLSSIAGCADCARNIVNELDKEKNMIDSNETVMYENGRDSGYLEGYEDGLEIKLETIEPHLTEAITLFFDMENLSLDIVSDILEILRNKFPDNKVIALPDNTSLESCSKDVLENIISMITVVIEQL